MILQRKGERPEPIAGDLSPKQLPGNQAMSSPEMEEWWKARRKERCEMARPNDNLVVGTRMLYEKNRREDGEVEIYKYRLVT